MKCKYCGKDGIQTVKGLSIHRRHSKDCYEKWRIEEETKDAKRTKVICKICGKS